MSPRFHPFIALLALSIVMLGLPSRASAQATDDRVFDSTAPANSRAPVFSEIKLAVNLRADEVRAPRPLLQADDPDSLTNGTLIGALIGAAAFGTLGGVICKAFQEPTDGSCAGHAFRVAAVGAAIGAGTGIAIDASMSRQGGVRFSVRKKF